MKQKPTLPHYSLFALNSAFVSVMGLIGFLFLVLPIVALVIRSVENQAWAAVPDSVVPNAIWLSLHSSAWCILLTALFGTPLAYILARRQFRFKHLVSIFVELPIVLPPAVAGLALLLTFGRRGLFGPVLGQFGISLPFTFYAVVLAQAFVAAPFYIRSAQVGFQNVSWEIEAAAKVDGADGFQVFWLITLPLARHALATGLVLCWARALGEFGATILFAGSLQGRTQTMPLLIYNVIERDINAAIWTGLILITLALAALVISQWLSHSGAGNHENIQSD